MPTKLEINRKAAEEKGYIAAAHAAEEQYGIPRGLYVGQLEQESAWRPEVISGKKKSSAGALGIAQFMPATAKDEGIDPLDTAQAIPAGAAYLAKMYKSTGSWTGALTAYNWGIGNYKKWLSGERKTQPKEAREYAGKVQARAKNFRTGVRQSNTPEGAGSGGSPVQSTERALEGLRAGSDTSGASGNQKPPAATPTQVSPEAVQPMAGDIATQPSPLPEPTGIGLDRALIPPPRGLPERGQRAEPFQLKKPKKLDVMIQTPVGPRSVQAETPEEEQLIQDLATSGETQLLAMMPELIQTRDMVRSAPLIKTRGDSLDKLLTQIVEGAG